MGRFVSTKGDRLAQHCKGCRFQVTEVSHDRSGYGNTACVRRQCGNLYNIAKWGGPEDVGPRGWCEQWEPGAVTEIETKRLRWVIK